eukprot:m.224339 g.224339  ORF g.224339 m.224339 type:complete len:314 (+) comp16452_c0_seq1:2012-2953(+)
MAKVTVAHKATGSSKVLGNGLHGGVGEAEAAGGAAGKGQARHKLRLGDVALAKAIKVSKILQRAHTGAVECSRKLVNQLPRIQPGRLCALQHHLRRAGAARGWASACAGLGIALHIPQELVVVCAISIDAAVVVSEKLLELRRKGRWHRHTPQKLTMCDHAAVQGIKVLESGADSDAVNLTVVANGLQSSREMGSQFGTDLWQKTLTATPQQLNKPIVSHHAICALGEKCKERIPSVVVKNDIGGAGNTALQLRASYESSSQTVKVGKELFQTQMLCRSSCAKTLQRHRSVILLGHEKENRFVANNKLPDEVE